jgi:hypothetical protein
MDRIMYTTEKLGSRKKEIRKMKALLRSLPVNLFNDLTFTLPESIVDNLSVEYFAEQKYT